MEKQHQRRRYPGLKPFEQEESAVFFGRDADLDRLSGYLQIEQTVVLHGRSGMGKSSLINAGLVPLLAREESTATVRVRFNTYMEGRPDSIIQTLKAQILQQAAVSSAPGSILDQLDTRGETEKTVWTLLKSLNRDQERRYVLIFDQFEEVFTWPEEQVETLKIQLAELAFGKTPVYYREQLRQMHGGASRLPDSDVEWLLRPLDVGLLFVVRSDRLSQLGNWSDYFPTILKNCFELRGLSRRQAEEALLKPAQLPGAFVSPPIEFAPETVAMILDYLGRDGEIESFLLQLIGEYIEQTTLARRITIVRPSDINGILSGDFFEAYYESKLSELPPDVRQASHILIEDRLVVNGRRVSVSDVYLVDTGVDRRVIDYLTDLRLIRREFRGELGIYLELSSDILLPGVMQARTRRLEMEAREKEERRIAEVKAQVRVESLRRYARWFGLLLLIILLLFAGVVYLLVRYSNGPPT